MKVWLYSEQELYPATFAEPVDISEHETWDVGTVMGERGFGHLIDLPDELAVRACAAWQEFQAVAKLLEQAEQERKTAAQG